MTKARFTTVVQQQTGHTYMQACKAESQRRQAAGNTASPRAYYVGARDSPNLAARSTHPSVRSTKSCVFLPGGRMFEPLCTRCLTVGKCPALPCRLARPRFSWHRRCSLGWCTPVACPVSAHNRDARETATTIRQPRNGNPETAKKTVASTLSSVKGWW